jgi:acetyl esterase/lipase
MKKYLIILLAVNTLFSCKEAVTEEYKSEIKIPYCSVDSKTLTLNAFIPKNSRKSAPAMVEIHGGWWFGGEPSTGIAETFSNKGIAVFSIEYRLGEEGGFPQNIRDCRNAIRFIRKNAARFNIDPERIGVMGTSAGGLLCLMVAMVPEDFDDGGATPELEGISARVCNCISNVPPTDFVRFWNDSPADIITSTDGKIVYRPIDENIPNDARPRLRILFHGVTPETDKGRALFYKMCPVDYIRKDLPPILISEGQNDPIVPGYHGEDLYNKLKAVDADVSYWRTANCGHCDPTGPEFQKVLDQFLIRTLKLD